MRLTAEGIKGLREALHDHGFVDDHVKYGVEAVIDSENLSGHAFSDFFHLRSVAPCTAEHRSAGILARANADHTKEKRR